MENKTVIYRESKTRNYSVISNEVMRDEDLSWKARGIMAYLLTLPDDWVIYLEELMNRAPDGKASFRSGWKELAQKGYVKREPIREKGKIVAWRTIVRESATNVDTKPFSPHTDFQQVENLQVENRTLLSTKELLSTNSTKKDIVMTDHDGNSLKIKQIISYLNTKANKQYKDSSNMTRKHINARLNEGFTIADFERVIDGKVHDWENDSVMSKYLRPATLFGNKFESYVNETKPKKITKSDKNNIFDEQEFLNGI